MARIIELVQAVRSLTQGLKARGELFGHFHVNVENQMLAELENKNREVHNMRLPRRHFLFIFFRQMDGQTDGPTF